MEQPDPIMVVDDEQDIVTLFCDLLQIEGIDAEGYTEPLKAWSKFLSAPSRYPLVITDIRMPKLNGLELTKRLKQRSETVKVFLMTAFAITNVELSKLEYDGLIEKPVSLNQLKKIVKDVMTSNTGKR